MTDTEPQGRRSQSATSRLALALVEILSGRVEVSIEPVSHGNPGRGKKLVVKRAGIQDD